MEQAKPTVFVITPFGEDFLDLFEEFERQFGESFDFTNAGDMDNQQNILKDIVEGIANADVIIADLTGLNANVFYELGLAHAMNKKVIIITQNIDELPFDIKSYRANQYSLQFNKLPALIEELQKLLSGAIDGSVKYGNPVSDYAPNFQKAQIEKAIVQTEKRVIEEMNDAAIEKDDRGFLDYIADINECSQLMSAEIREIGLGMQEMNQSATNAASEIKKAQGKNGKVDAVFIRNICRKLSEPMGQYAAKLPAHVNRISENWNKIENSYLELLDTEFVRLPKNIEELKKTLMSLHEMQKAIVESNEKIEGFINVLQGNVGMERRLNRSISALSSQLGAYLTTTDTMFSSIDRIICKSDMIIHESNL